MSGDQHRTLGVAIIGLGVGEQHAHTFADDPRCDVRWLIDQDPAKAKDVRERVGRGEIASDFDIALDDANVDVISIATYDHLHAEQVIKALNAGKHVFVEKPLCRTAAELDAIKAAWQKAGTCHLASNLVLREAPLYKWLLEEIESGQLGQIYAIDGDYLYGRLNKITEGWRKDVPDYSVIEGGGIHLIDLMLLIADGMPQSVSCIGNNIATADTDFRYDDFMAATYTFPSGATGRITANFACVHRHHHVLRVFGTEATFIYDDQGPRMHYTRDEDKGAVLLDIDPLPASKGALIPAFVDAIVANGDPTKAAEREFDLVNTVAATDMAHASGTTQTIEKTK